LNHGHVKLSYVEPTSIRPKSSLVESSLSQWGSGEAETSRAKFSWVKVKLRWLESMSSRIYLESRSDWVF